MKIGISTERKPKVDAVKGALESFPYLEGEDFKYFCKKNGFRGEGNAFEYRRNAELSKK